MRCGTRANVGKFFLLRARSTCFRFCGPFDFCCCRVKTVIDNEQLDMLYPEELCLQKEKVGCI